VIPMWLCVGIRNSKRSAVGPPLAGV